MSRMRQGGSFSQWETRHGACLLEVLRGSQGTLYGSGLMGGTLRGCCTGVQRQARSNLQHDLEDIGRGGRVGRLAQVPRDLAVGAGA